MDAESSCKRTIKLPGDLFLGLAENYRRPYQGFKEYTYSQYGLFFRNRMIANDRPLRLHELYLLEGL